MPLYLSKRDKKKQWGSPPVDIRNELKAEQCGCRGWQRHLLQSDTAQSLGRGWGEFLGWSHRAEQCFSWVFSLVFAPRLFNTPRPTIRTHKDPHSSVLEEQWFQTKGLWCMGGGAAQSNYFSCRIHFPFCSGAEACVSWTALTQIFGCNHISRNHVITSRKANQVHFTR